MKQAHLRDGAALTQFLHWLAGEAPKGQQTEMSAAKRLAGFRRAAAGFHGMSFPAISAADANGALPHYEATAEDRKSVGKGKSVSVRVELGGRRDIKKKKKT